MQAPDLNPSAATPLTPFLNAAIGALSFGWTLTRLTTSPPLNPIIRNTTQVVIAAAALHSASITEAIIRGMLTSPLSPSLLFQAYALCAGTAMMVVSIAALEYSKINDSSLPKFTQVMLSAATVSAAGAMLLESSPLPLFAKAAAVYGAIELSKTGYSMFAAYMERTVNDAIDSDTDTDHMELSLSSS